MPSHSDVRATQMQEKASGRCCRAAASYGHPLMPLARESVTCARAGRHPKVDCRDFHRSVHAENPFIKLPGAFRPQP